MYRGVLLANYYPFLLNSFRKQPTTAPLRLPLISPWFII